MDEQLHVRKELETFIEIPDVLYTLLLEFVGLYEWSDLKRIPLGVMCTCMLDVIIYDIHGMLITHCERRLRMCDKVYVTRSTGKYGDKFTFKLTIDDKPHELFHGHWELIDNIDTILFKPGWCSKILFKPGWFSKILFYPIES